jgi:hypothetical protein
MQYLRSFVIENREPFKPIEVHLYVGKDEFGYEFWQDTGFGRIQKVNDCWGFESQDGAEAAARALLCPGNTCPLCGEELEVDDEYMQNRYGEAYMYESVQWTYFCTGCEEVGTYGELLVHSQSNSALFFE